MCQEPINRDVSTPIPEGSTIETSESGNLVFMQSGHGVKELLGFVNVADWRGMATELQQRSIDVGVMADKIRYPEFEPEDGCWCDGGFTCWDCYNSGRRGLSEK